MVDCWTFLRKMLLSTQGGARLQPYSASGPLTGFKSRWKKVSSKQPWWQFVTNRQSDRSSYSFLRFLNMSPSEAHDLHITPLMQRRLKGAERDSTTHLDLIRAAYVQFSLSATRILMKSVDRNPNCIANIGACGHTIPERTSRIFANVEGLPDLGSIATSAWSSSCLSRRDFHWFIPAVVAPPISIYCPNRSFLEHQAAILDAPLESLALYGLPPDLYNVEDACNAYQSRLPGVPVTGLLQSSPTDQIPPSPMHVPEAKRLIYDSAKLARLDSLLHELKAGDHRVLIYFQMTRMMDLMEEYLIYRQYKYLRLDGSSKLEDRRDMVMEWQTRYVYGLIQQGFRSYNSIYSPDIFVFLLSTRAGGLGINLTAADTVVFYDHDWNPSNDAQAMDRAHRLGQTRQVTVYRLITKGTIDERIVQLARVKKDVSSSIISLSSDSHGFHRCKISSWATRTSPM